MAQGHLRWLEILEALERGRIPHHVEACPLCLRGWKEAEKGLKGLAPDPSHMEARIEPLAQRILAALEERRSRRHQCMYPRWAVAVALGVLCMAGSLTFWHLWNSSKERTYEALMTGRWSPSMAGLGGLIPPDTAHPLEEAMDSLDAILPQDPETLVETLSPPQREGNEMTGWIENDPERRKMA